MKTKEEVLEWAAERTDTPGTITRVKTAAKIARALRIAEAWDKWCLDEHLDAEEEFEELYCAIKDAAAEGETDE